MPFLGEPCETGFEWSTAGVVVDECGVDVERVADPERLEVRFEEDEGGAALGYDDEEGLCLDLGKHRGHGEKCFGGA